MAEKRPAPEAMERLLRLLGLGVGGGLAVPGVDGTSALLARGECRMVVVANDASRRAVLKVVGAAKRAGVVVVDGPAATLLGSRLGKPPVMVVGVRDRALA
ncbi:MAG TPA: hypothetical protein VHW65_02270, partial [Gemmatimonadales bacterium]|nr:hypothetical protein [Gemmatimonadales bacterium]